MGLEHEIPSDLLSCSHESLPSVQPLSAPLEAVKGNVAAMRSMIDQAKARESAEKEQQKKYEQGEARAQYKSTAFKVQAKSMSEPMSRDVPVSHLPHRVSAQRSHLEMTRTESVPSAASAPKHDELTRKPAIPDPLDESSNARNAEPGDDSAHSGAAQEQIDATAGVDYTAIVDEMDTRIERLDQEGVLRPTIINIGKRWQKKSRQGLLGGVHSHELLGSEQQSEKNRAFGLLDALTRGGGLPLTEVALHVIVAATHQFDKSIMQTVVQDNINPIEQVERSTLVLASTVHMVPVKQLLAQSADMKRISKNSPALFIEDSSKQSTSSQPEDDVDGEEQARVDLADLLAALEPKVRPDQRTAMGEVISKSIRAFTENGYSRQVAKQVVAELRKIAGAELWKSAQHRLHQDSGLKKTTTPLPA